jgi:hypothetical protein
MPDMPEVEADNPLVRFRNIYLHKDLPPNYTSQKSANLSLSLRQGVQILIKKNHDRMLPQ